MFDKCVTSECRAA